jgi:hypothetical protein
MPAEPPVPITTSMSDRDILLHILSHVEAMWAELEEFRPLLNLVKASNGNGGGAAPKLDMIGVLQARRELKKASREEHRRG